MSMMPEFTHKKKMKWRAVCFAMSLVRLCLVLGQMELPMVPSPTVESECQLLPPCFEWTASLTLGGSPLATLTTALSISITLYFSTVVSVWCVVMSVATPVPVPTVSAYVECVIGLSVMTSMACTARRALHGITDFVLVCQNRITFTGGRLTTAGFALSVRVKLSLSWHLCPYPAH